MVAAGHPTAANATEVSAATLDKIMSRLDRLEAENAALKKEVSAARAGQQPVMAAKPVPAVVRKSPHAVAVQRVEAPAVAPAIIPVAPARDDYAQSPRFSGIYVDINGGYGRGMVSKGTATYSKEGLI